MFIKRFSDLADHLRSVYRRVAGAGAQPLVFGVDAQRDWDWSVSPPSFGSGMQDNPRAGGQDYGLQEYFPHVGAPPDGGYYTGW